MLLYKPNAVLGIRSWSHFFYQCSARICTSSKVSCLCILCAIVSFLLSTPLPFEKKFEFQRVVKPMTYLLSQHCCFSQCGRLFAESKALIFMGWCINIKKRNTPSKMILPHSTCCLSQLFSHRVILDRKSTEAFQS